MVRSVLNIVLSFLLLITTGGFTISGHYCGTNLVSVTIDTKAKPCCDDIQGTCCHNESEHFQLKEDFVASNTCYVPKIDYPIELFSVTNTVYYIQGVEGYSEEPVAFNSFFPPPAIEPVLEKLRAYLL